MNNHIETFEGPRGTLSLDHSTGVLTAKWNNGYTETWSPCRYGYGVEAAIAAGREFIAAEREAV